MNEINEINEILGTQINENNYNDKIENVLDWDSFQILSFVSAVEDRYHTKISLVTMVELETIKDLTILLNRIKNRNK